MVDNTSSAEKNFFDISVIGYDFCPFVNLNKCFKMFKSVSESSMIEQVTIPVMIKQCMELHVCM